MPSRRSIVAGCCAVAIAGVWTKTARNRNPGRRTMTTPTIPRTTSRNPRTGPSEERKRGQAEAISASKSEWDRWVEYQSDDDEVRYVGAKGPSSNVDPDEYDQEPPDRDLEFETTPWDRWKHIRANDVAGGRTRGGDSRIRDRTRQPTDSSQPGSSGSPDGRTRRDRRRRRRRHHRR